MAVTEYLNEITLEIKCKQNGEKRGQGGHLKTKLLRFITDQKLSKLLLIHTLKCSEKLLMGCPPAPCPLPAAFAKEIEMRNFCQTSV